MTNVTHVITTIERGGAEKQLLILAEQQVRLGIEVSIIYLKGNSELETDLRSVGVESIQLLSGKNPLAQLIKLKKLIKMTSNVHAHLPRAELLCRMSLPTHINFIVSRHNAEPFFPGAPNFLSILLSRFVLSKARHIIAISNAVAEYLLSKSEVKDSKRLRVIHYGRNTTSIPKLELKEPTKLVGTVARLTEQKEYKTLLETFQLIHKVRPEYRLQIVGVGHLEGSLKTLSKALGLETSVDWIGKVRDPNEYIANWDVFILTSLYEGFGLVLLEAMSMGVPIVASMNSAIPEVLGLEHPGLATTSDPLDFYTKVLAQLDPRVRDQTISLQDLNLAKFDPKLMAQKIDELYV
jgi:glycosyltransferase involved in cell wall biosynthesis